MRVLISSIACAPYGGSEGIYGWRACCAIAKDHEVCVLTSPIWKEQHERAKAEGLVPRNMRFAYVGKVEGYHPNRLVARILDWTRYMEFNRILLPVAESLHAETPFDLTHVVTYTTWRVGSPLWKLGVPLIWGPLSGTEQFPSAFRTILSPTAKRFESFRNLAGLWSRFSPSVRATCRRAAAIPVTHGQALSTIAKLRGTREGLSLFVNVFFDAQTIAALKRPEAPPPHNGTLRILGSGNVEGRKGHALSLRALAKARSRGLKFRFTISSRGPELEYLQGLTEALRLSDCVELGNPFPRGEYYQALQAQDIYLLPSLREGAGQSMMEAMLAGCAPIVADWCGPGDIVTEACGYKIPVTTPDQMVEEISALLIRLDTDRTEVAKKGAAARVRIATEYSEDRYRERLAEIYLEVKRARR